MNDRILKALEKAGIGEPPISSLDHEQQLFALTNDSLLYQGSEHGPMSRVTLREISRIHSDHEGTLRVESAGQTAITASLLGFDPGRVQRFFQTVRDTTARAKQQPSSPLPGGSEQGKTFGSTNSKTAPSAASLSGSGAAAVVESRPGTAGPNTSLGQPTPGNSPAPILSKTSEKAANPVSAPAPAAQASATSNAAPTTPPTISPPPTGKIPVAQAPAPAPPPASPPAPLDSAAGATGPRVIKIGGTAPSAPLDMAAANPGGSLGAGRAKPSFASQTDSPSPTTTVSTSAGGAPTLQKASAEKTSSEKPSPEKSSAPANTDITAPGTLVQAALSLSGLATTLRVLAVVLVLGALGMGYFLWQQGEASRIPALWTVTVGLVTAVALSVLAEMLRFLASLGREVAAQRSGQPR